MDYIAGSFLVAAITLLVSALRCRREVRRIRAKHGL